MSSGQNTPFPLDVLIAEDDGDTRLAVRLLLEGEGYTCAEAEDGRLAVLAAQQCPPRIVLLDLMMPEVDGFTAAEQLRGDPRTRDVRIHCVTALDFPSARQTAEQVGCDGFLAKPFAPWELLEAVSMAVHSLRPADDQVIRGIERLEHGLAAQAPGRESNWCRQLGSALGRLDTVLREQATLMETAEGIFAGGDICRPTLARKLARLHHDLVVLRDRIGSLKAEVQGVAQAFLGPPARGNKAHSSTEKPWTAPLVDFNAIRLAGGCLVQALRRHLERGRSVLFESLNTDIGVGD